MKSTTGFIIIAAVAALLRSSNFFVLGDGEAVCEGHGYNKNQCQNIGCCHWDEDQCWSSVGTGPCNNGDDNENENDNDNDSNNNDSDDKDSNNNDSDDKDNNLNGEEACEGHGYNINECQSIGCCHWGEGQCWSSVGTSSCNNDNDAPSAIAAGEESSEMAQAFTGAPTFTLATFFPTNTMAAKEEEIGRAHV